MHSEWLLKRYGNCSSPDRHYSDSIMQKIQRLTLRHKYRPHKESLYSAFPMLYIHVKLSLAQSPHCNILKNSKRQSELPAALYVFGPVSVRYSSSAEYFSTGSPFISTSQQFSVICIIFYQILM